jgi:tetratricopeptide (TPR) repeat protein
MKNDYYKPWYLENGWSAGEFGGTKRSLYITKHYPHLFCGWYDYGMEYMREGECHHNRNKYYRISVKYLRKALEINDKDEGTMFWLAGQYIELNQYKKAVEVLTKAIELFPDDTTFLEMRAWSYCLSGDFTSAINDCTKYAELGGEYHEWLFILGETYFRSKQYRKAAEAWSECTKYENYNWGKKLRLLAAYIKLREYDNAIELCKDASWVVSRLYTLRGQSYKQSGDKVHAAQDFAMAKKAKAKALADAKIKKKEHKEWKKEQAAERKKEKLLAKTKNTEPVEAIPVAQKSLLEHAECYEDAGKLTEALNDYTAAIASDSKNYDAYCARAKMHLVFGDADKAIDDFSQAILCMPDRAEAYKERAQLYHEQAQFDKAIEDETAVIKTPACDETLDYTGWAVRTGNKTRDITDALNINPSDSAALFYKGKRFSDAKKYSDAIEYYSQALRYRPDMLLAYVYRAMAYELTNDYENAGKDYTAAWDMTKRSNTFIAFRLAYIYTDKHDFENAIACFSEVIKKDNRAAYKAYENRAILYEEMHRFDEAIEDYMAMLKHDDYWSEPIHVKIAEVYIKMGLFDKALEECESTSENGEYTAEVIITRGKAYMKKGDIKSALDDFNAVIEPDSELMPKSYRYHDSNYHQAFFNRGLLYFEQGEYEKALQDFSKVSEVYVPEVLEKRHAVYLALGKTKEAKETMEAIKQAGEENSPERYSGKLFGWVGL